MTDSNFALTCLDPDTKLLQWVLVWNTRPYIVYSPRFASLDMSPGIFLIPGNPYQVLLLYLVTGNM